MKIAHSATSFKPNPIGFMSKCVHIVDGGAHGGYIQHFAKASLKDINSDIEIKLHNAVTNKNVESIKQLNALSSQLKELNNSNEIKSGDYLTIPGQATVSLLNLKDRIARVLSENVFLTAENVKSHKDLLLRFLQKIYSQSDKYRNEINYMDSLGQSIESTYGVITEINKLKEKGVHVYIPAGHPDDNSIKWLSGQLKCKEELYHNIATGAKQFSPNIQKVINTVRDNVWYDFNLLAMADAHVVNVNNKSGDKYLFASRDNFANDSARGVYNFTPVRDSSGKILGYSFQDEITVEYPYDEFPENKEINNINKYVGLPINELIATEKEHNLFKQAIMHQKTTSSLPEKLYNIYKIFDAQTIDGNKLNMLGSYIDNSKKLIFDVNQKNQVLFQKCNCEGSERPSVKSMWGCCFSTVSAIKRDLKAELDKKNVDTSTIHKTLIATMVATNFIFSSLVLPLQKIHSRRKPHFKV